MNTRACAFPILRSTEDTRAICQHRFNAGISRFGSVVRKKNVAGLGVRAKEAWGCGCGVKCR